MIPNDFHGEASHYIFLFSLLFIHLSFHLLLSSAYTLPDNYFINSGSSSLTPLPMFWSLSECSLNIAKLGFLPPRRVMIPNDFHGEASHHIFLFSFLLIRFSFHLLFSSSYTLPDKYLINSGSSSNTTVNGLIFVRVWTPAPLSPLEQAVR